MESGCNVERNSFRLSGRKSRRIVEFENGTE